MQRLLNYSWHGPSLFLKLKVHNNQTRKGFRRKKNPCNVLRMHDDSLFVAFKGRWEARQLWARVSFFPSIFSYWRVLLFTSSPPVNHQHITVIRPHCSSLCLDIWPKQLGFSLAQVNSPSPPKFVPYYKYNLKTLELVYQKTKKTFIHLLSTNLDIFDEIQELSEPA